MERIGNQNACSYFDDHSQARNASNAAIRGGIGHKVETYLELAKKVAELQFLNRDHVLMLRGQKNDYKTEKGNSLLKARIFRNEGMQIPTETVLLGRFDRLQKAEEMLVTKYTRAELKGTERVQRHRIIRWAILQHYEICDTPVFDVTQSLRIAASFASDRNESEEAYLFAFGVPNISGAVTASSEAGLQIIRLSSACPPDAVRPHIQEGYLLGEYPEITDLRQKSHYKIWEMDFGRRLIAKFRFNPKTFWFDPNYLPSPHDALYPKEQGDPLIPIASEIKDELYKDTA